ncbi:outer membrane beta-barrel protein [Flagellimonas sp. 2504JD1-5]
MKQLFYFTSFLCIMALPFGGAAQGSDAATNPDNSIIIGARAGGTFSQFTQPGTVISGNIGAFGRYQALPYLQVQLDLGYDTFGGGRTDLNRELAPLPESVEGVPSGLLTRLEYLNRQVFFHSAKGQLSARLSLPELNGAPVQPQLIVGVNGAYIFRARENRDQYMVFEDGSRIILSNDWEEVGADYTSVNVGAHLGLALDFNLQNGETFTVEFTYDRGFTDLNNIIIGQPENIEVLRTHRFGIGFTYTILHF